MKLFGIFVLAIIMGMTPMNTSENVKVAAPEISLENPDGKVLNLSDLKGKIVLVDFWASWCGPCKKSRVGVKSVYDNYKNSNFENASGFEIFSVSLDRNKEAWQNAIKTYDMTWSNHVSDLKSWKSQVVQDFGIKGIPNNFLLNEKGEIIAKNVYNDDLVAELDKLIK